MVLGGDPSAKMLSSDQRHHESNLPWVEKYRPKSMNDIASQSTVVSVLRQSLQSDNLPHLLFYGPPGTGKTSTILALARELFGPALFRQRILELNASDERGINVVREKIKNFAKVTVKETVPGFPCPPFKLIILDEADSLTGDAQTALRRTIEQYSRSTRFCLICNYVSRIIDPLTSRCAKFRFGAVEEGAAVERMQMICNSEGIPHDREALVALIGNAEGDLRRAITLLQGIHRLKKPLTRATVDSLSGNLPTTLIESAVQLCSTPALSTASLTGFINDLVRSAHSPTTFLHQMLSHLLTTTVLNSIATALLVSKLAECEARIGEGADETVQVLQFMTEMRAVCNPRESVLYRTGGILI